jgi:hypothetical protein
MDRGGNPSFNPILNPNGIKDEFNATDPVDDVKNYLQLSDDHGQICATCPPMLGCSLAWWRDCAAGSVPP